MQNNNKPILIISGPTATGKTALAIKCAKLFNGEIISADSMQVYKYMNIGTAKATSAEQAEVKHHLIDIKMPDQHFNAFEFKTEAEKIIDSLHLQNKLPIICGGTGLFINTVLFNYNFDLKTKEECKYSTTTIVLNLERTKLYDRINNRVDKMINKGLIKEIENLLKIGYDFELNSFSAIGYKEFKPFFEGIDNIETCINTLKQNSRHYAKRQITWFKNQWSDAIWVDVDNPSYPNSVINKLKEKYK